MPYFGVTRSRTDALTAEATLPSWSEEAGLYAAMRAGNVVKLSGAAFVPLPDMRYFFIDGAEWVPASSRR